MVSFRTSVYYRTVALFTAFTIKALCGISQTHIYFDNTLLTKPRHVLVVDDASFFNKQPTQSLSMTPSGRDSIAIAVRSIYPVMVDHISLVLFPKDSIVLQFNPNIDDYEILGGKNMTNHTLLSQVKAIAQPFKVYDQSLDNYKEYRDSILSVKQKRLQLLDSLQVNERISQEIQNYAFAYIKYAAIFALLKPLSPNKSQHFKSLIDTDLISRKDFNEDRFSQMDMYQLASISYCTLTSEGNGQEKYPIFINAIHNFEGPTRETILEALFLNRNMLEALDSINVEDVYNKVSSLNIKKESMEKITGAYLLNARKNKPVPLHISKQIFLISTDGEKSTFKSLIDSYKGKKLLIDFWASWCGPCITNLPNVKMVENKYESSKDYKVLYISIDDKQENWLAASKKHDILSNQFLIDASTRNVLMKYLGISGIPRYILIAEDGKILDLDAPRPNGKNY